MKELTAFDITRLVTELQTLAGGKIEQFYQIDKKDFYFQIYAKKKYLLRIVAGKYVYTTQTRPEFPSKLHRFCSFLRKHVKNAWIKSIEQINHERIIKFTLESQKESYELYVELFGKGILVLVKGGKIISVSEEQTWADRTLKPGEVYVYPQKADTKTIYAKQKAKGSDVTMEKLDAELSPLVVKSQKKVSAKEKEIKRIQVIVEKQEAQLAKVLKKSEELKEKGNLIYQKHADIHEIFKNIDMLKGKSWPEKKKLLKKFKIFKDVKEKEGKLIVEL